MQILGPQPRPIESETLGVGPSNLCFNKPSRWFWCTLKVENHCFRINLNSKISEKALFRINKKGSVSTLKLQQFNFASRAGRSLLPPHIVGSWWVPSWGHPDIFQLPLQRAVRCSYLCLWSETISLAALENKITCLGDVKLLVGISKEPILSIDILNHTSFRRTSLTNVPENRLIPKWHDCTVLRFLCTDGFYCGFCWYLLMFISFPPPIFCETIPL